MREEAKILIDSLLLYQQSGIPKNLTIFGARGSGKTLMVKYLAEKLNSQESDKKINFLYVNIRYQNTSYKILAHFLKIKARGPTLSELFERFEKRYPRKTVIVLDEIDLMGNKDRHMEILYFLSRSSNNYMVIILSNTPRLLHRIDASTRSTLQPEIVYFKNYDAQQIYEILEDRAKIGLTKWEESDLRKIAALTTRNTISDVRVAIKTLLYSAVESALSVDAAFERAAKDIVIDVIQDLNDKCLLILESCRRTKSGFAKDIYQCYVRLSEEYGETPFSYMHFYNNLSYLQSCSLIVLVATKVDRTYTNRIRILFDQNIVEEIFKTAFGDIQPYSKKGRRIGLS